MANQPLPYSHDGARRNEKRGKVPPHHYSVSLAVARDPLILHLHHLTLQLLKDLDIEPLNPSSDLYFPHLTLAGIGWGPRENILLSPMLEDLISMPIDSFHLCLGRGDDIGQYLETL